MGLSQFLYQRLKEYKVKLDKGLSSYDVEKRRERYGWNELKKENLVIKFRLTAFYMQSVAFAKLAMHQDAADMLNEAAGLEEKKQKAMSLFMFLFMYAGFSE
ncbi:unnamed protein product [Ilex paraguariensis]|uniref:Cation-transporting P-type ATPase N-terminal domain-containing protein n=1 Tax=Ilex paraguariensis TaxID=185542 RepID=A0ABC8R3F3_9AQUA